MRILTVGRNPQNNVVLSDPMVSVRHLELRQYDNGQYSAIDLNSTNGTYVNGQRIQGEVFLRPSDTVQIGNTRLQWWQYFGVPISNGSSNDNTLAIVLGSVGGGLVLIVALLLLFVGMGKGKNIPYSGPQPRVVEVKLNAKGQTYEVDAAEGQVVVFFDKQVSHRKAAKILKKNHVTVLAQMPMAKCYLVEVPNRQEGEYVKLLSNIPEINYAYPNIIDVACSVSGHVIDNFVGTHGKQVAAMMEECDLSKGITTHDVGGGDERGVLTYQAMEEMENVLSNLRGNDGAVINMSFGPDLRRIGTLYPWQNRVLWNDRLVLDGNKRSYIERTIKGIQRDIAVVKAYDNKDFVVAIASGNEGMKQMEAILKELRDSLTYDEREIFERHFILVSAKDNNKEGDYPNDVSPGTYDRMLTKVDISDMTAQDLHWQGTSFATPRLAGYIMDVANKYDEKVVDVLQVVRKVTATAPNHIVTRDLLEAAMRKDMVETKPAHVVPSDNKSTDKGEEVNPKEESKPSVRPQTIYASLNHKEDFTLSDGSQGFVDLYSMGLGDLWLKIYWKGYSPIDLEWHLDGHGMEPASNKYTSEYYGTGGKYSYELYKEEYSFRWVSSDADVKGINVTITPR